jgi:hypothetical protein
VSDYASRRGTAFAGTAWAAALNTLGMPILTASNRGVPGVPVTSQLASAAVGVVLLAFLFARRKTVTVWVCAAVFLINTASVATTLFVVNQQLAENALRWAPFQPNKLGALVVALLAPEAWVGVISIAAYVVAPLIQLATFSPAIRAKLAVGEPWATIGFGAFALALLVYHLHRLELERRMTAAYADAVAKERLARALLAVRDLSNTPLQTIELSLALLRAVGPKDERAHASAFDRVERALRSLRDLNRLLSERVDQVNWNPDHESFDSVERLRE